MLLLPFGMSNSEISILAVNVGNTRTGVALFHGKQLKSTSHYENAHAEQIVQGISEILDNEGEDIPVIFASVNDRSMRKIVTGIESRRTELNISYIGMDLQAPVGLQLDPEAIVGQDRLLNGAAAFDCYQQACVVIDAGTAITVDFIDGKGTFHGGAIGPGSQMQLDSLHSHTALLPDMKFSAPDDEPFGANTTQAMLQGVFYGIRGMVRHLIERYAEAYEAYPKIIATGGDAHVLFDDDELIEKIDDELTLRGIAAAGRSALEQI